MPEKAVNVRVVVRAKDMDGVDEIELVCESPILVRWGMFAIIKNGDQKKLIKLEDIIRIEAF